MHENGYAVFELTASGRARLDEHLANRPSADDPG
jgi:hypothetical protein